MKIDGLSDKALEFQDQNTDLPIEFEGVDINIVEVNGKLRLMLEIKDNAGIEKIKNSWWLVKSWQDRLLKYQGPTRYLSWSGKLGFAGLLARLSSKQKRGQSWAQITKDWNRITGENQDKQQIVVKINNWRKTKKGKAHHEFYD